MKIKSKAAIIFSFSQCSGIFMDFEVLVRCANYCFLVNMFFFVKFFEIGS